MAKPKKGLNPTVAFVVSIVLALFALGLPMIGVTVNLWLGVLLLTGAFTLSVYAFLIWEGPYKWRKVLRISTVICAAVLYFPLIGYQVKEQYRKDHSVATSTRIAAEASHQPNAPADPNPQPITPAPKRELPAEPAHLFTGGIHGSDNTILNDPRSIVGTATP